jgi:CcdB protein
MSQPDWLDVVRHRARRIRAPYLLVVQHHAIPSLTRLVAPVSLSVPGDVDVLAPRLTIDGVLYRARILDISAIHIALLGETVVSMASDRDAILGAIDVVLHGYPVGLAGLGR